MSLEEKELPPDFVIEDRIANAVRANLQDGKLPCARAFRLADELDVTPILIGKTADALQVHLNRCQLGLFGYPEDKGWQSTNVAARPVPEGLREAIAEAAEEGELACIAAWLVADRFGVPRIQVGYLADQLDIRITQCQLGAF